MAIMETIVEIPVEHERNIFGSFDANIRKIEKTLNVTMIARDGTLKLVGDAGNVKKAEDILMQFLELSKLSRMSTMHLLLQWIMIRQIWLQWIRM